MDQILYGRANTIKLSQENTGINFSNHTHVSTLAWQIPWTEEPGRLQSIGSRRVGHDWATSHTLVYSQSYGFPSSHIQTWELDHKESWALKNLWFQIVVLKILENPLDFKEIKPVNPKGNQPWKLCKDGSCSSKTLATWCEELTHWRWERLKAKEEGSRG